MSLLDRVLGGESNGGESCCDVDIEEIDPDEPEENASNRRSDRTED